MIRNLLRFTVAGILVCSNLAYGDEEIVIKLRDSGDYGSGPSVMDNLYAPGGLQQTGLFVGNPNNLSRRDRVLLKYDIKPLLLSASRLKSAQLVYSIDYVVGPEESREIRVEHFTEPVGTFEGTSLNSADVEEIAVVEITRKNAKNGGNGHPLEVDVTEALKNSVARGDTSCAFRLKDTLVEGSAASVDPAGVIVAGSESNRPTLRVILND